MGDRSNCSWRRWTLAGSAPAGIRPRSATRAADERLARKNRYTTERNLKAERSEEARLCRWRVSQLSFCCGMERRLLWRYLVEILGKGCPPEVARNRKESKYDTIISKQMKLINLVDHVEIGERSHSSNTTADGSMFVMTRLCNPGWAVERRGDGRNALRISRRRWREGSPIRQSQTLRPPPPNGRWGKPVGNQRKSVKILETNENYNSTYIGSSRGRKRFSSGCGEETNWADDGDVATIVTKPCRSAIGKRLVLQKSTVIADKKLLRREATAHHDTRRRACIVDSN